ncbi:MAG: T9SS type A sorting domain-containing protein, partial [Phaeodactylibacter sp.]|nr:T9SS type A sorting domain-containing protein [Phaeodactylibacter sp.]
HLYLELAEGFALKEVEVFDAIGQVVQRTWLGFAGANAPERIDIAGLPAGMYSVKVSDGARFFVGEFVKVNQ